MKKQNPSVISPNNIRWDIPDEDGEKNTVLIMCRKTGHFTGSYDGFNLESHEISGAKQECEINPKYIRGATTPGLVESIKSHDNISNLYLANFLGKTRRTIYNYSAGGSVPDTCTFNMLKLIDEFGIAEVEDMLTDEEV